MSNSKLIKNQERGKTTPFKAYVPQYQLRGISPLPPPGEVKSELASTKKLPFGTYFLPKSQKNRPYPTTNNLPYAEMGATPFNSTLPNVGNNSEVAWAGMDAMLMDEEGNTVNQDDLDSQKLIDNNWEQNFRPPIQILEEESDEVEMMMVSDTSQLNIGYDEFVLAIRGEIISTGPLDEMQQEVRALVLGGHPFTAGEPVEVNEIVLLKRVSVKVGVFIDE